MHCYYEATIPHENGSSTSFIALDKCLNRRKFFKVLEFETKQNISPLLSFDLNWITILRQTHSSWPIGKIKPGCDTTNEDETRTLLGNNFEIQHHCPFAMTAPPYHSTTPVKLSPPGTQTLQLLKRLELNPPVFRSPMFLNESTNVTNEEEIDISDFV